MIEWSHRAQKDLAAVYAYIAADNEVAARRVIGDILRQVNALETFPLMGRMSRNPRYRELVIDAYIVVYALRRDRVIIARVWHGAQRH